MKIQIIKSYRLHYKGSDSSDKPGDRDKAQYLRNGNCLITQRCTLAGANLAGSRRRRRRSESHTNVPPARAKTAE